MERAISDRPVIEKRRVTAPAQEERRGKPGGEFSVLEVKNTGFLEKGKKKVARAFAFHAGEKEGGV